MGSSLPLISSANHEEYTYLSYSSKLVLSANVTSFFYEFCTFPIFFFDPLVPKVSSEGQENGDGLINNKISHFYPLSEDI